MNYLHSNILVADPEVSNSPVASLPPKSPPPELLELVSRHSEVVCAIFGNAYLHTCAMLLLIFMTRVGHQKPLSACRLCCVTLRMCFRGHRSFNVVVP